jgi:GT2 family glycosyltransferase
MPDGPVRIAVVMACYNRRETTLRCLRSLFAQRGAAVALDVYLLDDASSDGTSMAVRAEFPQVQVLEGDGHHFWGGGMYVGMKAATRHAFDFLLWLNDDVELKPDAITTLLDAHDRAEAEFGSGLHVISGPVADPSTGELTYSGFKRRNSWHPARLTRIDISRDRMTPCDTMNGNCVLIPQAVVQRVGLIDPVFVQQLGDIDYGYRITRAGGRIWIASEFIGFCSLNVAATPKTLRARLRRLFTPHGLPIRPWTTFMWRYGGVLGVSILTITYAKALLSSERRA